MENPWLDPGRSTVDAADSSVFAEVQTFVGTSFPNCVLNA